MIRIQISCEDYAIKEGKKYPSLNTIRLIVPKKWDCKEVRLIEMNESYDMSIEKGLKFFDFDLTGDVISREVKQDSYKGGKYVYVPLKYEGSTILMVPL